MVQGTIQLGVKRPQSKSLPCAKLRGFFNGGDMRVHKCWAAIKQQGTPARQHLILQTIDGRVAQSIGMTSELCGVSDTNAGLTPAPVSLFYDNPSRKRVARCTNIPHTGALPTVKGVGQRLRKGFQGGLKWHTSLSEWSNSTRERYVVVGDGLGLTPLKRCRKQSLRRLTPVLESLSSAAKLRHSARNTRLRLKPSPDLNL